jgi:multiple sugar transport system permease protein
MSVPTVAPDVGAPTRAKTRRRALAQRKPGASGGMVFPTLFMLVFLVYFLMPLFWLVVASTKSLDDLFSSFGLWFSNFNLVDNIKDVFKQDNGGCWPHRPVTGSPSSRSAARTCCSGSCSAR